MHGVQAEFWLEQPLLWIHLQKFAVPKRRHQHHLQVLVPLLRRLKIPSAPQDRHRRQYTSPSLVIEPICSTFTGFDNDEVSCLQAAESPGYSCFQGWQWYGSCPGAAELDWGIRGLICEPDLNSFKSVLWEMLLMLALRQCFSTNLLPLHLQVCDSGHCSAPYSKKYNKKLQSMWEGRRNRAYG